MLRKCISIFLAFFFSLFFATAVFASPTNGTIDPNNTGDHFAKFFDVPGQTALGINFGKFTTQSSSNITITSDGFRGFAWSELAGWIVTNCLDTTSGCSSTNGNFKISVADDGTLSGYAWGENTGWINFGPFNNSSTTQVQIGPTGIFKGTDGDDGYAWSQSFGWILFDCTQVDACVTTDYIPVDYREEDNPDTGGSGNTLSYVCSDGVDNDLDGLIDYPLDPGCASTTDGDESNSGNPSIYTCSDGIDNDSDGLTDFPNDIGCTSYTDNSEVDRITPPLIYICSDGIDNDSDGLTDFPNDIGCTSVRDNNEEDVVVPPPGYACSDGIDNDSDGLTDHPADPGCLSLFDQSEINTQIPDIDPPDDSGNPILTDIDVTDPFPGIDERTRKIALIVAFTGLITTLFIGTLRIALNTPQIFSNFFAYIERAWSTLLSFLGFRRFSEWGIVYDAKTKQPIDPAYVRLIDEVGKEVATAITDINGRYGFLAMPGTYTMTAQKTHYTFPSQQLAGKDQDEIYKDLYFGEKIIILKKDEVIVKNIPMDATGFDWNEFAKRDKKILSFFIRHEVFFSRLINILFYFGFISSIFIFILSPILYNGIILLMYIVFEIINRSTLLKPRASSVLRNGQPYPFVLVEIYNATLNQKIAQKITSAYGRFFSLVPKGSYYLKILEKSSAPDGGFIPVYTSDSFDVKEGYIHRTIII